jgi:CHAT domain-containing protein
MFLRARLHRGTRRCTHICVRAAALLCLLALEFSSNASAQKSQPPAVSAATPAPQTPAEPPVTIEAGKTIDRDIAGNQSHAYQIAIPDGQCAVLIADQQGIDLAIDVLDSDSAPVVVYDSEKRRNGEEKFELPGTGTGHGTIHFNVRAVYFGAPPARYQLRLADTHACTAAEKAIYQARILAQKSSALSKAGNYDDAIKLTTQAIDLASSNLPADDPFLGQLDMRLALLLRTKGDLAHAEEQLQQAVDIFHKSLGDDDPLTAQAIGDQGLISSSRADYAAAAEKFQQAIDTSARVLAPDDPQVATFLMDMAVPHEGRGNLEGEMADLQGARTIYLNYLAPDDDEITRVTYDLGDVYMELHQLDLAKKYTLEALTRAEKKYGPNHPYCAYPLQNLGIIARREKNYDQALEYLWRSEKIREKSLGLRHPITAQLLVNIANVDHDKGDYNEAIKLMLQALEIMESTSGPYHPNTLKTLASLSRTYAAQNDPAHAYEYQARMDAMIQKTLALNLATGSEREKLDFAESISNYNQRSIWMAVAEAPENQQAADGAALAILQRKSRVLDAVASSMATLRAHLKPEDQALLDQLSSTTADLAKLTLSGPKKMPLADYQSQLHALEQKREQLEAQISQRSNGYFEPSNDVTLESVENAIPENAALIEYATYKSFSPRAASDDAAYGEAQYVAFVLTRHAKVRWANLGSARDIDAAVAKWRDALADPSRQDAVALARALDAKVMQPVRAMTGDSTRLLISPEGDLNLIPFEALVDEQQRFAVERFSITYLTTGRDLLRLQKPRASGTGPMVVANPLFGEPAEPLLAESTPQKSPAAQAARAPHVIEQRRSVTSGASLSDVYFAPLPGTEQEAKSIESLFPDAKLVTGPQATKATLKAANAPEILHIATHGFFLQDFPPSPTNADSKHAGAVPQNPLLRAGLALTGANLTKDGNEDGILTGLEASGLNLWGTKLVTLSACETGIGTVRDGEGVYGLRRAFFLAGTETLVMSLWEVSDRVTREMMSSYYSGLKRGLGRGDALRQAQLEMLKRKDRRHPFYWASFIQAGEWANLSGQR